MLRVGSGRVLGQLVQLVRDTAASSLRELKKTMKPPVSWCPSQHPLRNKKAIHSTLFILP